MPISGEKLDELLTGLVDNELSIQEEEQLRKELDEHPSARARLEELQQTKQLLGRHFEEARRAQPALPDDFSERVVRLAEMAKAEQQTAESSAGHSGKLANDNQPSPKPGSAQSNWRKSLLIAAALAATVMLAIWIPSLFPERILSDGDGSFTASSTDAPSQDDSLNAEGTDRTSQPGQTIPSNPFGGQDSKLADGDSQPAGVEEPSSPEAVQYVSQLGFGLRYLLVVDIEMTQAAADRDVLNRILRQSGIDPKAPIVGNAEVEQAISESRMTVNEASSESPEASIFLLRAAIDDLGEALDRIYLDQESFPEVAMDLAWDDANVKLIQTIAQATGTRFAVNQKFAAPVTLDASAVRTPAFAGIDPPARYVSAAEREHGFGDLPPIQAGPDGSSLETTLLFVRIVDE